MAVDTRTDTRLIDVDHTAEFGGWWPDSEQHLVWAAIADSLAAIANPWGAFAERTAWYLGFLRDHDALARDFWNAAAAYTLSPELEEELPGQERLFDPERVGA